jgi:LysM repeat protein
MLQRFSRVTYLLAILALVLVLTGCELRRDDSSLADPGPVSDLPPTLAPLNAETESVVEATAVPTIIVEQAETQLSTAAQEVAAVVPEEAAEPASVAMDLSADTEAVVEAEDEAPVIEEDEAPVVEEVSIAETEPSAADLTVEEESDPVEALVVDATTTEELPSGGPVAAAPPASPTFDDSYAAPAYGTSSAYTVRPGDTLFNIAQRFGTNVETIMYDNGLIDETIRVGDVLTVSGTGYVAPTYGPPAYDPYAQPAPAYEQQPSYQQPYAPSGNEGLHLVASGENLFRIAMQYGTTVDAIAAANGLPYPFILQQGQQLLIPAPGAAMPADGYSQSPYAQQPAYDPYAQQAPGFDPYAQQQGPAYGQQPYDNYAQQQGSAYGQQPYDNYAQQQPPASGQQPYDSYAQQQQPPAYDQQPYDSYAQQQQPPAYGQQPSPAYGLERQPAYDPYAQGSAPYAPQDNVPMNPGNTGTHTITPGETLFSIAQRYGTSADALASANGLTNPNQVYVGQVLYLP